MARGKRPASRQVSALETEINKRFGEGTVRRASDPSFRVKRVPTGILSVDWLLGGGFPRGRHVEIHGSYAVGKTAIAYRTIASAQRLGELCVFVDAERTFDADFAAVQGVDIDALVVVEQEHGDRVVDLMEVFLRDGAYGVIVLDSIASLLPQSEREQDMSAATYGTQQAKLMSRALRRLTTANRSTVLIYVNQQRESVGQIFGPRYRTPGGRAMGFYASHRLELSRVENIRRKQKTVDPKTGGTKERQVTTGHRVLARLEKDKAGSRTGAESSFVFDYSAATIDPVEDVIYVGRQLGLVKKNGNRWWVKGRKSKAHSSRGRFVSWLRSDSEALARLEQECLGYISGGEQSDVHA